MTSSQSSTPAEGRLKTTSSGASAALRTTSSVRFPLVGMSTDWGVEYSRKLDPPRRDRTAGYRRAGVPRFSGSLRFMAEQTSSSILVDAPAADVMAVIADFPAYPAWAKGVTVADVKASFDDADPAAHGRAQQVYFALDVPPIKDEYTLSYTWDGDRQVTWTLVQGKMLRSLDGAYILDETAPGRTEVTYRLALDVSIPLIGMLKRKGEKILIDTALKGLKKRVESGA